MKLRKILRSSHSIKLLLAFVFVTTFLAMTATAYGFQTPTPTPTPERMTPTPTAKPDMTGMKSSSAASQHAGMADDLMGAAGLVLPGSMVGMAGRWMDGDWLDLLCTAAGKASRGNGYCDLHQLRYAGGVAFAPFLKREHWVGKASGITLMIAGVVLLSWEQK